MIQVLIVGLGNIGLKFDLRTVGDTVMTHTGACLAHPSIELLGGVDPDAAARNLFQKTSSRPAFTGLKAVSREALAPSLIIISTPTETHLPMVKQALEFEPKAILLEKPLATSTEDGRSIVQWCKEAGVLLAVNYFRRFVKGIEEIGEKTRSGGFGRPRYVSCLYSGGLLNNGSHYLDLLMAWFGKPYAVRCWSAPSKPNIPPLAPAFTLDYQTYHMNFVEVGSAYGLGELDLFFEQGRVRFENYCEDLIIMESSLDPVFPGFKRLRPVDRGVRRLDLSKCQFEVLDVIVRAMSRGEKIPSTGETALAALEICADVLKCGARS